MNPPPLPDPARSTRLISLRGTRFHKKIVPVIWIGAAGFLLFLWLVEWHGKRGGSELLLFLILVVAGGYFLMKTSVQCLMDEVWDDGDALIVRKDGQEVRIDLLNILSMDRSMCSRPEIITLELREPCVFGRSIKFLAPERFFTWGDPPVVKEQRRRMDERRQRAAQSEPMRELGSN